MKAKTMKQAFLIIAHSDFKILPGNRKCLSTRLKQHDYARQDVNALTPYADNQSNFSKMHSVPETFLQCIWFNI